MLPFVGESNLFYESLLFTSNNKRWIRAGPWGRFCLLCLKLLQVKLVSDDFVMRLSFPVEVSFSIIEFRSLDWSVTRRTCRMWKNSFGVTYCCSSCVSKTRQICDCVVFFRRWFFLFFKIWHACWCKLPTTVTAKKFEARKMLKMEIHWNCLFPCFLMFRSANVSTSRIRFYVSAFALPLMVVEFVLFAVF